MHTKSNVVCVFASFLFTIGTWSANSKDSTNPEALISRALLQENLWTEGTPPMVMRAEIQVSDSRGALARGRYIFNWVSPARWREEIRFGSYYLLRVGNGKGYWQKSALSYQPEAILRLDSLLHLKEALRVGWNRHFGKVKSHDKKGVQQECAEVRWIAGTERILCFDDASGTLLNVDYPMEENQNPPEISRIEFGAFNNIGGKLVPFEIRALRGRSLIASVKVLEITKAAEENPALFDVPSDSEFWAQCDDMREAELVDRIQPVYPMSARQNFDQGRVMFYAVIEADGSLSHLTVIHRASSTLESAAVEAVRQWHYKPAACGMTPIRVETSIPVDFWIGK